MARVRPQTLCCYSRLGPWPFCQQVISELAEEEAPSGTLIPKHETDSRALLESQRTGVRIPVTSIHAQHGFALQYCTPQTQLRIHVLMQLYQVPGCWPRICT